MTWIGQLHLLLWSWKYFASHPKWTEELEWIRLSDEKQNVCEITRTSPVAPSPSLYVISLFYMQGGKSSSDSKINCKTSQSQQPSSASWVRGSAAHLAAASQGFHRMGKFSPSSSSFTEQRVGVLVWGAVILLFFLDWNCFCDFWYAAWPWVIRAWVSSTIKVHQHLVGWFLCTLVTLYHSKMSSWAWRHAIRWDRGILTEPNSAMVHPNQSAVIYCDLSVIYCDFYYLASQTCHCSCNRVKGCHVANVSQCTAITYGTQSHTVATHCLIGWLWKIQVLCQKISFKL